MNSMKLVIPLRFISWKKTPNDAVTPQRQSQFTPKMKANAVSRLLSSLAWIDQYSECNGMTSFMEFSRWQFFCQVWALTPYKHSITIVCTGYLILDGAGVHCSMVLPRHWSNINQTVGFINPDICKLEKIYTITQTSFSAEIKKSI